MFACLFDICMKFLWDELWNSEQNYALAAGHNKHCREIRFAPDEDRTLSRRSITHTVRCRYNAVIFSCDQAALRMAISVCLSVRLSVTPFWQCSHHRIIMKFSEVITNDQSDVHTKGQGQRSKVKVTEVTTQLSRFRAVTLVWIHIWWNDTYSLWCCLGEVPYCFSRSSVKFQGHTALKIVEFDPDWAFPDCNSSLISPMAMKCCTKLEVA